MYLNGGPVYDDHYLFEEKLNTIDLMTNLGDADLGGRIGKGYFRPLAMSIMAILGSVTAVHIAAMLIHTGSVLLVRHTLGSDQRAIFAAAVFGAHPLCSEAIGWASSLFDVLALHLGLWAWHCLKTNRYWLAGLTLFMGLLCKESAIAPPIALAVATRLSFRQARGLIIAVMGYGWMRWAAESTATPWNLAGKEGLIDDALLWPLSSLIIPHPLTPIKDILATPNWAIYVGLSSLSSCVGLRFGSRETRSGILLIATALVLALPPTLDSYFAAERLCIPCSTRAFAWLRRITHPPRSTRREMVKTLAPFVLILRTIPLVEGSSLEIR